jgi:hypothetical protein
MRPCPPHGCWLAALDYLTQRSPVSSRVDANRLSVMGHSMGGGGAMYAALHRPSLWAAVGLAPFSPSQNLSDDKVPTLLLAGQNDGTVSPSSVQSLYNGIPAGVEKGYLELAGAGHAFPTSSNSVMMRKVIPWLKIFLDHDTRYSTFLCPSLADSTGISGYSSTCPLDVPGGGGPGPGEQTFSLVGAGSGQCVDVPNVSQTNGSAGRLDLHRRLQPDLDPPGVREGEAAGRLPVARELSGVTTGWWVRVPRSPRRR